MALVRAKAFGIDRYGAKVRAGQVFDHEGPLGAWMELVEEQSPSPAPSEAKADESPSEAAADEPQAETKAARKRGKGAE